MGCYVMQIPEACKIPRGRIRCLEQELRVAGEEMNSLKARNKSSKIKDRDISDDL